MRTKFLLAMALPMVFAACSNEDDLMTSQEVAGQKLASKTILTVGRTEADTKLNADGWENGDKVGLAWFNNASSGLITDGQGQAITEIITTPDNKIYANHLFTYADGSFTNEGDIYNGSYFAYFPYARQSAGNGASEKTIKLNTTQKDVEASKAFFAGVFSVSARDMITADDINADGAVEKQFSLKQLANGIAIKTTLGKKDGYSDEQIAGMKITQVTLTTGGKNAFTTDFTLDPQKLPVAIYDGITGEYDAAKTLKEMTVANLIGTGKLIASATSTDKLSVDVSKCGATLASENDAFLLFTLPTNPVVGVTAADVKLVIRTIAGEVELTYADAAISGSVEEHNNKAIEKLVALLSSNGYKTGDKTYKLSEILNQRVALDFKIDMNKFTAINNDIKTAEEWNAAVKYFDTFMPTQTPTFTITDDIEFTAGELMTLPKKGLKEIKGSSKIVIKSGNNVIDSKIAQCSVDIEIEKGASLTVNADASSKKEAFLTLANTKEITNGGTLTVIGEIAGPATDGESAEITNNNRLIVGENGKINSVTANGTFAINVTNNTTTGVITVSYNSYVHHDLKGTIKGVIDGNDATAKSYYAYLIARMTAKASASPESTTGTEDYPVACNSIELKNITVTEGDKSNTSQSGLPWGGSGSDPIGEDSFKDVDVVLHAANLYGNSVAGMNYKSITSEGASALAGVFEGGGITVKSGTLSVGQYTNANQKVNSTITINTANLEVKKGAKLVVNKTTIEKPLELINEGTISLTGDKRTEDSKIKAVKITNKAGGVITVGEGGAMTYEGEQNFSNDGDASGNIKGEAAPIP